MFQLLTNIFHESDDSWHMMDEQMMFWPFGLSGIWMWLFMIGYGLAVILLTVWTYQDANERDESALLWAIVVFFTMGIGVLVYVLIRRPKIITTSKTSNKPLYQGKKFSKEAMYCEDCGNILESIDLFCAKCGTSV